MSYTDNPSGSGLERAEKCPPSMALPRAPHTGDDAIKGTDNHGKIEGGLVVGGDISGLPFVVQKAMEGARQVDVEVAYAINVETEMVRVLGRRIDRNYGKLEAGEIPLTLDASIWRQDGTWVWDWKSRKRVTPAAKNLQLLAGAVAVLKTEGLTKVHGAIGYLDDGEADVHTFDAFDVPPFFVRMREILNRVGLARTMVATGGTPAVHSGPWCQYCPSVPYCPAHNRLALQWLGDLDYVQKQVAFMSAEQVGKAWTMLQQIEKLAEKVNASLRLRAGQEVVPLPNGKRLALVEKSRSNFDKNKAIARIKELGGSVDDLMGRTHFTQIAEVNMPSESQAVATDHE